MFQKLIDTDIPYLILDAKTEQVIGATSFYQYDRHEKSVAIGYTFLGKKYWGGEYNQSIKNLMMDFAFEKLDKVIFHVASENIRSQMALGKIGAIKEKEEEDENGKVKFTYSIFKNKS
ncbi:GNAT family N-acetyltransferase [Sphingobacterium daejeonense]|uniref:GNAT family N-acetyltransferase n=1 Tax=Sphingobacterium daejeonense TaxID=371142 RepID=UPI0010FE21C9|nr:GNAT family N-acetyltransferase [Sphingobacterium daejeonense]